MLTGATSITQTRYVHADPLGNVIGLTKPDGTVDTDLLGTNEWGVPGATGVPQADTMRLRWKGMLYEADSTQLYYVRARWYDPIARRFISEDPIGLDGGIK
ncbi:MAG: RHS repeat-associated core domain-containing protein [Gemmatimonadota bacterium]